MTEPKKMNRFKVTYFFAILAVLLFSISGIVLIINYAFSTGLVNELKQASNFDRWHVAMILAGIFAIAFSILNAYFVYLFSTLKKGEKDAIVGELIYILGIDARSEQPSPANPEAASLAPSANSSIFGFGRDDDSRWTFSGRIPKGEGNKGKTYRISFRINLVLINARSFCNSLDCIHSRVCKLSDV